VRANGTEGLLFQDVRVFTGTDTTLTAPQNVLVLGNRIHTVSRNAITPEPNLRVTVIDGGGRTLMPGLIDAHWHSMLIAPDMSTAMTADAGYLNFLAGDVARQTLMQGFTSVRDMGGPSSGLKRAIDTGLVPGPRIFPSGAMISQTGGHGDFRMPHEVPRATADALSHAERMGVAMIADSPDVVRVRTREQLMLGATQIKLMAGGGVSSIYDPLDVTQYTVPEIRAAVEAAENWGTYVAVHAYTSRAVRQAIEAGVKSIEHGQLVDEDVVRLMAREGVWWSLQPFLDDEDSNPKQGQARIKQLMVSTGTARAFELARKHNVRVAFGTDILFNRAGLPRHAAQLAKLATWYSPGEVLRIATGDNGELLALSGERNSYPGKLGVIEEGAMADLLLVDGDPIANLRLIEDPDRNFIVIVKDGRIIKNTME
jgi:imidazolonepropionase-like amidohydrolase